MSNVGDTYILLTEGFLLLQKHIHSFLLFYSLFDTVVLRLVNGRLFRFTMCVHVSRVGPGARSREEARWKPRAPLMWWMMK